VRAEHDPSPERSADAAFAVGERVADGELERRRVGTGTGRAAEAAVGERERADARDARSVDGGGVAADDEPLAAVVLARGGGGARDDGQDESCQAES
jgi:hypothetical protein